MLHASMEAQSRVKLEIRGTVLDNAGEALGLRENGFSYLQIADCLDGTKFILPFLCRPTGTERASGENMLLIARGSIRFSKGLRVNTKGYSERIIPLRRRAVQVFGTARGRKEISDISRERIEEIGIVKKILRHAVATFSNLGESKRIKSEIWQLADPWSDMLDEIVDANFFTDLQTELEASDQAKRDRIRAKWLMNEAKDGVVDHARQLLFQATNSLPCIASRRLKSRIQAEAVFWRRLRGNNGLPFLFQGQNEKHQKVEEENGHVT